MSDISQNGENPKEDDHEIHLESLVIKSSRQVESFTSKCITVPIFTSTLHALRHPSYEECIADAPTKPYFHGRKGNPTRDVLEQFLGKLETAKYALTFASGAAAINTVLQSFLHKGSHVVSMETIYGGTMTVLKDFEKFGVEVDFDNSFDPTSIVSLVKDNTDIVWLESPANPTMFVIDIKKTVEEVKKRNPNTMVVVDNTFLTPLLQKPIKLGADISVYSCSKYLNGHGDMFFGAVVCDDDSIYASLLKGQENYGAIPSPYDCYNLIRALKTLPLRMEQHAKNGQIVAEFLENHPCVEKVLYPGLKSHPQFALALKQQNGKSSGGIGLYLKGAGLKESYSFLRALNLIMMAPSIGTDFSIANLPCKLSHGDLDQETKIKLGITDNFIRLSVGLECATDLIQDLDQALRKAVPQI